MSLLNPFQVERPWGNFRQFTQNSPCTVKILTVKPNESLSLQKHQKRAEFWRVINGSGTVQIGEMRKETKVNDEHEISIDAEHRLSAGPDGIQVLEISVGDFTEEDLTRLEDKYGRELGSRF